jgi:hypothetical protein
MKKLFDQLHIISPRNKTPKAEIPPREITPRENRSREIGESTVILPPQEPEDPHSQCFLSFSSFFFPDFS